MKTVLSMVMLGMALVNACQTGTEPGGEKPPGYVLGFDAGAYALVRDTAAPRTLDVGTNAWTAEIWVKPGGGGDRRQFLIGQWGDPGIASWALELEEGCAIAETHDGRTSLRLTDSQALSPNVWHHVAFAFMQGSGTLYVDGKAVAASSRFPLPMTGVQPVRLGAQAASRGIFYGATYMLTGELAEARVWSITRTAQQIADARTTRLQGTEAGLLAYWPLTEGSGDPKDVVMGVAASLGGPGHAAAQQPAWVQDAPPLAGGSGSGYVLRFDGTDYAQGPFTKAASLDLGADAWTAEAWVKPGTGGDRRQFIVGQWGDPGESSWALELEEGYLIGETHDGLSSLRVTDSVALGQNTWHHVALAFQRGTGTVYVDGKAIGSSVRFPLPMVGVQPLRFGAQAPSVGVFSGAIYPLTGRLAQVRLWSVSRSAQQIASGRFQRLTGKEAGLVAYWPLDEGAGDPRDRVHGLVASPGGPGDMGGRVPAWVEDTPPVK